jgi:hypothetical protein
MVGFKQAVLLGKSTFHKTAGNATRFKIATIAMG